MKLSGWGGFPICETRLSTPRDDEEIRTALADGPVIARGNGRAYGDAAIGTRNTLHMRHFDRMIAFDESRGQLVAEAGVLASDIITVFLPRGWFLSVTPGTKHVTLGGMIASDVHGKNHHVDGSFGDFVDWIDLMGPDGRVLRCSRDENAALFCWTLGGMGLTGVILRAALRLRPVSSGWIRQTTVPARNIAEAMEILGPSRPQTYSVAWIDCLARGDAMGRSLVMLGDHAAADELDPARRRAPFETPVRRGMSLPLVPPAFLMNGGTVRLFNEVYFRNGRRKTGTRLVDWDSYFYPLDAVKGWNRVYGRRGFAQFQCVLPLESAGQALGLLLRETSAAGLGSFLAVLKRFGKGRGGFSFPMPGYTLALDFPISRASLALMDRLDAITLDHGGRFYLAKDSRMPAETLRRADPRTEEFADMRNELNLRPVFLSMQSQRLGL